jgi:3-hydroxyisobutyrate dehydrogenase-like beta-hydroxyacid dehydrogenase
MKIGFLGLGIMGRPMAANLAKAGHELTVWNRTPGKHVEGAQSANTPSGAVRGAEVVWICVSDTAAVEQVLFGGDGAISALARGTIVADSSTIAPAASVRIAERLREQGCDFVDAPVTGSKAGAESAQLVFIVGGREETVERLQPLFRAMGKNVIRVGENGKGLIAKLAMNLQIALIYEGFAEGLTLAGKLGVAPEKLVELVQASMIRSGVVDYKAPFVLQQDFSPNFPLRLMLKDIRLMMETAEEAGVRLPATEVVRRIYERAAEAGLADQDYAVTIRVVEEMAKG